MTTTSTRKAKSTDPACMVMNGTPGCGSNDPGNGLIRENVRKTAVMMVGGIGGRPALQVSVPLAMKTGR